MAADRGDNQPLASRRAAHWPAMAMAAIIACGLAIPLPAMPKAVPSSIISIFLNRLKSECTKFLFIQTYLFISPSTQQFYYRH